MVAVDDVERLESLIRVIRQVPQEQRDGAEYEEMLNALFEVVEEGRFRQVADLHLLIEIRTTLQEAGLHPNYGQFLLAFDAYVSAMRDTHAKLSAVLDRSVGIEELLSSVLNRWPQLTEEIGSSLPDNAVQDFQAVRIEEKKPSSLLNRFFHLYFAELEKEGAGDSVAKIRPDVLTAVAYCAREERLGTVRALFAGSTEEKSRCLRVSISLPVGSGEDLPSNKVSEEMNIAVREAANYAIPSAGFERRQRNLSWRIEEPVAYEGESIGLAIAIGVIAQLLDHTLDCYTAFTGTVTGDGRIGRVSFIPQKLGAAQRAGMQRVFVPIENLGEAQAVADGLKLIGVGSVPEAWRVLTAAPAAIPQADTFDSKVRRIELECIRRGLKVVSKRDFPAFLRLIVTDHRTQVPLDLYRGKRGITPQVGGQKGTPLYSAVNEITRSVFGSESAPSPAHTSEKFTLADRVTRNQVETRLRAVGKFQEKTEANCDYRLDFSDRGERVIVRQFTSGTLTVTLASPGSAGTPLFSELCQRVNVALGTTTRMAQSVESGGPDPAHASKSVASTVARPFDSPWIGTDESGKGDYFGPLVSAAVYVDDQILEQLASLGVRDSKLLADSRARDLAGRIRTICRGRCAEVEIFPERYNELYEQFRREGKTLNSLLSWGHVRALEDLLGVVDCSNVIVDQFADEHYIRSRLLAKGRAKNLNIVQMPRAEVNLAVAAASILARDKFLSWLERASAKYGLPIPKGASEQVIQAAKALVARYGREELPKVAKLHFRTTESVLANS